MRSKFLKALALTTALVVPAIAHAQTVTVTSNPTSTASASGTTRNTPGATAVGGVIYVLLTDYDTASYTPSVADASGNTYTLIEGPVPGSDNWSHGWLFRAPVTTASASAELVTASGTGTYNSITVIYLAPPSGYTLGGVDCHAHATADSGTIAPACTAIQANDVFVGGGGWAYSGAASGTTLLQNDTASSGAISGYNQSPVSGSHNVAFLGTPNGGEAMVAAEKVSATTTPPTQCGSSVTPAVVSGKYVLQCQLNGNLTINNPTGMAAGGGDSFLFQLQQPNTEPTTHYTVTFGTAYNQSGHPSPNTLKGLSTTGGQVDDFFGVSMPTFTNVWSAQRVEIGGVLPNMGD